MSAKTTDTALLEFIDKLEHLSQFQDKVDMPARIERIWQVFLEDIGQLIDTETCALFLVSEHSKEFVLEAVIPADRADACRREIDWQIECGTFSWIINRRQPALIPSIGSADPTRIILLPLSTTRRTMGVILVRTPLRESSVTRENLKLLSMLMKQCSLVMENAILYENLEQKHSNLERANTEIRLLSITDPLTGSYNRGFLTERMPQEIQRARRYRHALAVVMCDIDRFKAINDQYGHRCGDQVLKGFAECLGRLIRDKIDWVARYGGEEFLVVLPETDLNGAAKFAQRACQRIAEFPIETERHRLQITASLGFTAMANTNPSEAITSELLIESADRFLYEAKRTGRNRVCGGLPAVPAEKALRGIRPSRLPH